MLLLIVVHCKNICLTYVENTAQCLWDKSEDRSDRMTIVRTIVKLERGEIDVFDGRPDQFQKDPRGGGDINEKQDC